MKVVVLSNQSLADIAIQVYGSMEGVFTLAFENGISVTSALVPGQTLEYSPENILDKKVVQYYTTNKIYPATADNGQRRQRIFDNTFDNTFN